MVRLYMKSRDTSSRSVVPTSGDSGRKESSSVIESGVVTGGSPLLRESREALAATRGDRDTGTKTFLQRLSNFRNSFRNSSFRNKRKISNTSVSEMVSSLCETASGCSAQPCSTGTANILTQISVANFRETSFLDSERCFPQ